MIVQILVLLLIVFSQMQSRFRAQIGASYDHRITVDDAQTKSYKNRKDVYLWVVLCTEEECNCNHWSDRFNWQQYLDHYKITNCSSFV